jgi:elongation factor Ts
MAEITASMVKDLREKTGVGMMECKKALNEAGGDMEKASTLLRERGLASAGKRSARATSQGLIATYIHMDRIGVMVEVNCETDFVARTDDFRNLCKDIAMHIAAANPPYVKPEDVPAGVVEKEKDIFRAQVTGKPANIIEKIVEGKLGKFYEDNCLVEQVFVKDPEGKKKIKDIVTEAVARIGENIQINRFARFEIGASGE